MKSCFVDQKIGGTTGKSSSLFCQIRDVHGFKTVLLRWVLGSQPFSHWITASAAGWNAALGFGMLLVRSIVQVEQVGHGTSRLSLVSRRIYTDLSLFGSKKNHVSTELFVDSVHCFHSQHVLLLGSVKLVHS